MKRTITFILILALCLTACGAEPSVTSEPETAPAISTISKEHCFLCGDGAKDLPYWGQDNVGIISLNTFEVMPIAINRYDGQGALIEKNINRITTHGFQAQENGFCTHAFEIPDRGHASVSLTLNNDSTLNTEQLAAFLCQNCLDSVLSEIHESGYGVGIINFATREIHAFEKNFTGFGLGDFYIHICGWDERDKTKGTQKIDVLVFYQPLRYEEDA